jgi:hypothetical protein
VGIDGCESADVDEGSVFIVLDTGKQKVPSFPSTAKIAADLYIVSNFSDLLHARPTPVFLKEHGQVSRTASRKHSLQIAPLNDAGKSAAIPLLGFPPGKKWILYAPYPDKTLIRNELAYNLSREAGEWAAHTKAVELVIFENGELKRVPAAGKDGGVGMKVQVFEGGNGQPAMTRWWTQDWYHGVYILEEKIEASSARVDIDKGNGLQLHGVLARSDKQDTGDPFFRTSLTGITVLPNVEPKRPSLAETGELQRWFDRMESALFGGCTIAAVPIMPIAAVPIMPIIDEPHSKSHSKSRAKGRAKGKRPAADEPPSPEKLGFLHWPSFIDNFLVQELSRNVDGYRWSTYFFKETSSAALADEHDDVLTYNYHSARSPGQYTRTTGGPSSTIPTATSIGLLSSTIPTQKSGLISKWARRLGKLEDRLQLHMAPIWDFNIAFGNAEHLDGALTNGWVYRNDVLRKYADQPRTHSAYWYHQLLKDKAYCNTTIERWRTFRDPVHGVWSDARLTAIVRGLVGGISAHAIARNFIKWPMLKKPVWPEPEVAGSFKGEVNYLVRFLLERAKWMDGNIEELMWTNRAIVAAHWFRSPQCACAWGFEAVASKPVLEAQPATKIEDEMHPRVGLKKGLLASYFVLSAEQTKQHKDTGCGVGAMSLRPDKRVVYDGPVKFGGEIWNAPTTAPTAAPTSTPTAAPTMSPTALPTNATTAPTASPTNATVAPTVAPTNATAAATTAPSNILPVNTTGAIFTRNQSRPNSLAKSSSNQSGFLSHSTHRRLDESSVNGGQDGLSTGALQPPPVVSMPRRRLLTDDQWPFPELRHTQTPAPQQPLHSMAFTFGQVINGRFVRGNPITKSTGPLRHVMDKGLGEEVGWFAPPHDTPTSASRILENSTSSSSTDRCHSVFLHHPHIEVSSQTGCPSCGAYCSCSYSFPFRLIYSPMFADRSQQREHTE